jgi:hypothetical protein
MLSRMQGFIANSVGSFRCIAKELTILLPPKYNLLNYRQEAFLCCKKLLPWPPSVFMIWSGGTRTKDDARPGANHSKTIVAFCKCFFYKLPSLEVTRFLFESDWTFTLYFVIAEFPKIVPRSGIIQVNSAEIWNNTSEKGFCWISSRTFRLLWNNQRSWPLKAEAASKPKKRNKRNPPSFFKFAGFLKNKFRVYSTKSRFRCQYLRHLYANTQS